MTMRTLLYLTIFLFFTNITGLHAQEAPTDVRQMTREEVLNIPYDKLIEMPLDQLLKLADIVGVSLEELYEMILNKDVVSASKKAESSFDAPLSTSVVSYDEIMAAGCRTIEEALRLVPGMIVREKTTGNFDIHIRGNDNLPPNHMLIYSENSITLVMINGRPVYNYVHGGTFWETLPIGLEDIDRIEVVRGPSSALYGPNAASGVVNIITKQGADKKLGVSGSVQAGNLNSQIGHLRLSSKLNNKLSVAATGNFTHFNRTTDELYVFKEDKYVTKEALDTLKDRENPGFDVFDPNDDVDKMWPDPSLARQTYGGNAYLMYNGAKDLAATLSAGYQSSDVISSTMGDNPTPTVGRASNTYYADLSASIKGFHLQTNYMGGWQDIVKEDTGFKVDVQNINANLEYDYTFFEKLNVRPGVAFQQSAYDDLPYLRYKGQGFLNGRKELQSMAGSLRLDYHLTEYLRIIGAFRGEKYNTHDDMYFSYQFIPSLTIAKKHNIRFVASRANRGPFLVDSYTDYTWERDGRPEPGTIVFKGQGNLDLLTIDMFELGYRVKPVKNIQADLELFYIKGENYGALYPDSVNINGAGKTPGNRSWVRMQYDNIELKSKQYGLTATISWVINKNLVLKGFGTIQKTELENVIPITQDKIVENMLTAAFLTRDTSTNIGHATTFSSKRENMLNKSTPTFYGGFIFNGTFLENKLTINVNSYFYSSQKFQNKYMQYENYEFIPYSLDSKLIISAKVDYRFTNNLSIFVNGRNLQNLWAKEKIEFAYLDEVTTSVLGGVSFIF